MKIVTALLILATGPAFAEMNPKIGCHPNALNRVAKTTEQVLQRGSVIEKGRSCNRLGGRKIYCEKNFAGYEMPEFALNIWDLCQAYDGGIDHTAWN